MDPKRHLSFFARAEPNSEAPSHGALVESTGRGHRGLASSHLTGEDLGGRPPMYGGFYGVNVPPFDLTSDPRFLFLAPTQREVLSNLRYALSTSRGFTLLTGDAGTGKTTLIRTALAGLDDSQSRYVLLSNPTLGRDEFYEFLVRAFGLSAHALESKTAFLAELQADVEARFATGGLTGIIVDEAQSLPYELLEEIRLLGNIDTPSARLLNIVLAGQTELSDRLNEPSLRQLKQRISLRCMLVPFSVSEASSYIAGRIRIAGGLPERIFTREAVIAIHKASAGNPRTINVLCDNVLISGFALQAAPIPARIVEEVCRDFDLTAHTAAGSGLEPATDGPRIDVDMDALSPKGKTSRKPFRFSFFGRE
jgi:type II secretory pathway predicted ATPase ExeA